MKALFAVMVIACSLVGYSQTAFSVYFDINKYALTKETRARLDSFLLVKNDKAAGIIINLDGYCDATGHDGYNNELSLNRVTAIKDYLLKNGIQQGGIANTTGHGEKDPLNENKTGKERQLNRRVVISITNNSQTSLPESKDDRSLTEKIADTTTRAGTHIILKNINFFGGSPFLLPESFPILDELIEIMRVNRNLVIEIQGHICCIASPGDSPYGGTGNGLSEERAKMIYAELLGKGIEPNRVSYKGFGHSMPIYPYPEKTEEERVANRRVEIRIISK